MGFDHRMLGNRHGDGPELQSLFIPVLTALIENFTRVESSARLNLTRLAFGDGSNGDLQTRYSDRELSRLGVQEASRGTIGATICE